MFSNAHRALTQKLHQVAVNFSVRITLGTEAAAAETRVKSSRAIRLKGSDRLPDMGTSSLPLRLNVHGPSSVTGKLVY